MKVTIYSAATYDWFGVLTNHILMANSALGWGVNGAGTSAFATGYLALDGAGFEAEGGYLFGGTVHNGMVDHPDAVSLYFDFTLAKSERFAIDLFAAALPGTIDAMDPVALASVWPILAEVVNKKLKVIGSDEGDMIYALSVGTKQNIYRAGDGDDTVVVDPTSKRMDIDGGNGIDWIEISDEEGSKVDLKKGTAKGKTEGKTITATGFENIEGTDGSDVLKGSDFANTINGNGGFDYIKGRGGNDTINGGAGNDQVDGGAGEDTIDGGADRDTIISGSDKANDTITGGTEADDFVFEAEGKRGHFDNDTITDFAAEDTLYVGIDRKSKFRKKDISLEQDGDGDAVIKLGDKAQIKLEGVDLNTLLTDRDFTIKTGAGIIQGKLGTAPDNQGSKFNDVLYGGVEMWGEKGSDTLTLGATTTTMIGGSGADTFDLTKISGSTAASRSITDYQAGEAIKVSGADYIGLNRNPSGDIVLLFNGGKTMVLDNTDAMAFTDLNVLEL